MTKRDTGFFAIGSAVGNLCGAYFGHFNNGFILTAAALLAWGVWRVCR